MKESGLLSRFVILTAALALVTAGIVYGQTLQQTAVPQTTQSMLVNPAILPPPVRFYTKALGDRLTKAGNERTVLTGTYTTPGTSAQAQLTWQAPGSVRFDRADQPTQSFIYSSTLGLISTITSSPDTSIFESLLDDTSESFLYAVQRGTATRLLGLRFRADDGTAANYSGPWFDVYALVDSVNAQPGKLTRSKLYNFDSQSGLLRKTEYTMPSGVTVTTEFNRWQVLNGQAFPGEIVRKENGTPVFTFSITGAMTLAATTDSTFVQP